MVASRKKTERLFNLVLCLLATRQPISAEHIRESVQGYADSGLEAFKRMFERDKDELRELGIPLETVEDWDGTPGYRIRRDVYELPELTFTPDEAAVLGLAARTWQHAQVAEAASSAMLKLRAAGIDVDSSLPGIEPRVGAREPAFLPFWQAVLGRYPVRFGYRRGGEEATRVLEPWGVVSWHGRWYVAGHDRDRDAERVFRLDRVVGDVMQVGEPGSVTVPPDTDVRRTVTYFGDVAPWRRCRLRVRAGAGFGLRRQACDVKQGDGWDELELDFTSAEQLADMVAAHGADVVVVEPDDLRKAVLSRLEAVAAGEAGG
ncbi:MAG: WYL domain-containing protein [Streptosporangiales bacterium]|nr:WYL domain-containing protein [Streptosporangiales bacterium]